MTELWFDSAVSLAANIKARDISARELLDLFLARANQHAGTLNAIVWRDDAAARAHADAADAALTAGTDWGRFMACQ